MNMDSQQVQDQGKQMMQTAEEISPNVYMGIVAGSIALSAALFLTGKKNLGIFVGLWPPTILNLAMFAKRFRPSHQMP